MSLSSLSVVRCTKRGLCLGYPLLCAVNARAVPLSSPHPRVGCG